MTSVDLSEPFAHEKLSPVLALYKAEDFDTALDMADRLVKDGGYGHTASLYINPLETEKLAEKDIDLYLEKKRIVQKRVHKDQAHEMRESLPAEPAAEEDEGISPLARKLAEKLHVDYHKIESGSGPEE